VAAKSAATKVKVDFILTKVLKRLAWTEGLEIIDQSVMASRGECLFVDGGAGSIYTTLTWAYSSVLNVIGSFCLQ
jgi:hypothetical protein